MNQRNNSNRTDRRLLTVSDRDIFVTVQKALLVGIIHTNETRADKEESLKELTNLVKTAGSNPSIIQTKRVDKINPKTFIGKGSIIELEEISKFWLHQANARMINLIVSKVIGSDDFDTNLAPLPIQKFGNLASAGSLFSFNLNNDLKSGEKGIICSFGAGYSVGNVIVRKIA